jgi:DNA polymerase-3 subunit delta'
VAALPVKADMVALTSWSRDLAKLQRSAEHPWSMPVMAPSLVLQAQRCLDPGRANAPQRAGARR